MTRKHLTAILMIAALAAAPAAAAPAPITYKQARHAVARAWDRWRGVHVGACWHHKGVVCRLTVPMGIQTSTSGELRCRVVLHATDRVTRRHERLIDQTIRGWLELAACTLRNPS